MAEEGLICKTNFKKYTTILNEAVESLVRLSEDLNESLNEGHRTEAKCKIAVVSLQCIDRKYRNLLFDGEPPCVHCTSGYLEKKKKQRDEVKRKLRSMRREYYMQEEHMSKLAQTLQEAECKLVAQSTKCTHEGLLISRLLWKATKPRRVLEKLTSQCTEDLHEFLNLAEGCIYAFFMTYGEEMPEPTTDEYQYVTSLCGILTNLSSIPEGRLFLMWNPMGRTIYTLILDVMGSISCAKAGSLKWIILIVIYNILVNPFGRKLVLKHPLLRENLQGCLSPNNCGDIMGAALNIIKIFIDDYIEDSDMIAVLMYQLPLKQVYSLSKSSCDMSIRKIAQAIVSRVERKMADCYNCPSCKKAVTAAPSFSPRKQNKQKKKKPKKRLITKSMMTSDMSICAECETDDTDFITSESEVNLVEESTSCNKLKVTSSIIIRPPDKKPFQKKLDKATSKSGEVCETPSLKAKSAKKIGVTTIFKPSTSKSLVTSSVQMRGHSTGNLDGVPPLKQKSKSVESVPSKPEVKKLMNVNTKTVMCMLSKLDLETYLRPSYTGLGIPLKDECTCLAESAKQKQKKAETAQEPCVCSDDGEKPPEKKQSQTRNQNIVEELCVCSGDAGKGTEKVNKGASQEIETVLEIYVSSGEGNAKEESKPNEGDQSGCVTCCEKPATSKKSENALAVTSKLKVSSTKLDGSKITEDSCVCPGDKPLEQEQNVKAVCECFEGMESCGQKACICIEGNKNDEELCVCGDEATAPVKRKTSAKKLEKPKETLTESCCCSEKAEEPPALPETTRKCPGGSQERKGSVKPLEQEQKDKEKPIAIKSKTQVTIGGRDEGAASAKREDSRKKLETKTEESEEPPARKKSAQEDSGLSAKPAERKASTKSLEGSKKPDCGQEAVTIKSNTQVTSETKPLEDSKKTDRSQEAVTIKSNTRITSEGTAPVKREESRKKLEASNQEGTCVSCKRSDQNLRASVAETSKKSKTALEVPSGRPESSKGTVMKLQKTSSVRLPPDSSAAGAVGEVCSMHSTVIIRKTSPPNKQRRKSDEGKTAEKKCVAVCSKVEVKEDSKKGTCDDECEACLYTLPKIDVSKMFGAGEGKKGQCCTDPAPKEKRKSVTIGDENKPAPAEEPKPEKEPKRVEETDATQKKDKCVSCGCGMVKERKTSRANANEGEANNAPETETVNAATPVAGTGDQGEGNG